VRRGTVPDLSSLIELAVGVACLVAGWSAIRGWREPVVRISGVVVALAGLVAVIHAVAERF
jgi:hypothetical protein